jgi:hypothetical protein
MTEMSNTEDQLTVEQWLQLRKDAALKIDPETAHVTKIYGATDPYGIYNLSEELQCYGDTHFARSPDSGVWVWFGDLPEAVRNRLWEKLEAKDPRGDVDDDDCPF